MSSNQTSTITPEIGEKIKLIFTTLVDLVIYGVNHRACPQGSLIPEMRKEPKNAKFTAEEQTSTEGQEIFPVEDMSPTGDDFSRTKSDVKKYKPIYYTYTPDTIPDYYLSAEGKIELSSNVTKTGTVSKDALEVMGKANTSRSSLAVNV